MLWLYLPIRNTHPELLGNETKFWRMLHTHVPVANASQIEFGSEEQSSMD